MRYYVTSDIHGFYTPLMKTLETVGYFEDQEPHKLMICGDIFDRGSEALELQTFVLDALERDQAILIRGNHEDLYVELVTEDEGLPYDHHVSNGTYATALALTGYNPEIAVVAHDIFAAKGRMTPFYQKIIPATVDYYETEHYIFTHGWIPCVTERNHSYSYIENWREATAVEWKKARWINGMDAVRTCRDDKTIVCGHYNASYGHLMAGTAAKEHGKYADYSPFYAPGIVAIDACTAKSGTVNCIVIEDEPINNK